MGHMIIDGRKVEFTDEKNVLSVIRKAGINIPTLCYHSEVSTFGACRLCTVEDERGKTFASCSEQPRDGMVIYTNSGRVKKYRKLIVELLLAAHCRDCTTCVKSGECVLQELAHRLGVQTIRFKNTREYHELDTSSPSLVRDPNKCILCGDCVRACEELQGIGALGFAFRGTEAMVMPAFNKKIAETECVNCGQCRVYCPTGAIAIKTHMDEAWEALADPNIRVVAQIAPAVRVAVGDHYGLTKGKSVMGKIVNALHRMGFDEVYDTSFSADLTIMEESAEFLDRIKKGEKLPLLTSIINYVDLMKRENPTDPKIQEYLRILDEKSQRLKVLTEDVVEASKASTGNIKLEMNDIDFVEMVQQVIGEFEEKFQEKNLTMMVHFTDEPSIIYADGQRMWRVLENVFGNVVKYAMEGTRVYAEISNRNKKVTFSLKNISAQPLNISADELTERFIRGDVARNTEGSGLGLSIAKSLTELQGGEFKLYLDGDLFKVMITFVAKNYSK